MSYLKEIDVSKNWLLPIDDLLHSDVMERHLSRTIGIRDASGVPGYLSSALKAGGVNSLLQLLSVPEEKLKQFLPSNKPSEKIVEALELSASRLLKEGGVLQSVYAGKYAAHSQSIPRGHVEDVFPQLAAFIGETIYNGQNRAVYPGINAEGAQDYSTFFKKTVKMPYVTTPAPDSITLSPESEKDVREAAFKTVSKLFNLKAVSKKQKEDVLNFCKKRNVHFAGQLYAFKSDELKSALRLQSRNSIVAAMNAHGKGVKNMQVSGYSSEKDRKALGLKFSDEAGGYVFPRSSQTNKKNLEAFIISTYPTLDQS